MGRRAKLRYVVASRLAQVVRLPVGELGKHLTMPLFPNPDAPPLRDLLRLYLEDSSMRNWSLRLSLSLVCVLPLFLSVSTVAVAQDTGHDVSELPIPKSRLTDDERDRAVLVATANSAVLMVSPLDEGPAEAPTVLSGVESVDDNNPATRLAIVTTYSYESNETTRALVDLVKNELLTTQTTIGTSAPLADVERDTVERLVLSDPHIAEHLGHDIGAVEVEMLLTRTQDRTDPFYNKRVVMAIMKTDNGYLRLPPIFVNLTDLEVIILDNLRD